MHALCPALVTYLSSLGSETRTELPCSCPLCIFASILSYTLSTYTYRATIGLCIPMSYCDLLFAECMIEEGAEVHLIMPFSRTNFYRYANLQDIRKMMPNMERRCDLMFQRAIVHYITSDKYMCNPPLYTFARKVLIGCSIQSAADRQTGVPVCLAMINRQKKPSSGEDVDQSVSNAQNERYRMLARIA